MFGREMRGCEFLFAKPPCPEPERTASPMQIRDRIKELRRVPAHQLRPNAKNWRTHPTAQQDALRGVLAEIGYAGALLRGNWTTAGWS